MCEKSYEYGQYQKAIKEGKARASGDDNKSDLKVTRCPRGVQIKMHFINETQDGLEQDGHLGERID